MSILTSFSRCRATFLIPARSIASLPKKMLGNSSAAFWPKAPTDRPRRMQICILDQRWDEVFVIPDILCNAGGVIVSYFEWVQGLQSFLWTESEVTDKLFRILEHSFAQVIRRAKEHKVSHRTAAMAIGVERVIKAKQVRGLFP